MDKLIITPGKVRGLGNLLTPKQVEDLILYQSDVSIASDGTFIMDYTQNNLIVSDYETVVINSASTSVTVRVLDDNQSPIADVPVTLYDGATSIKTGTTDSDGYAVLNYTLSTDGSHMLHVEGNNLKSKRWEVFVKTISSITLSRSSTEVWKGSEVTFSALVQDSNQNIIAGVPVQFILSDGVSVLKNVTVTTDANGTASTSYDGKFFSNGNLTCNATCGSVSESTLVTEIYRYYVNESVHDGDLTILNYIPQGEVIDANGNFVLPKNQPQNSVVTFSETLPEKFNIEWEYKGSITNFNGTQFGIGNLVNTNFNWYNQSVVIFTNNAFTVNGQTFSGSLQTGDIFNFNYDGSSLEISQIRSSTVLWSKVITVSIEDGILGFNLGTYNGYKMNNVIATYYDRNPPVPSFDGISLTGDKSILSAADSEYVTLSAQLMDGQSSAAVSGETVSFKVYKASDDTLIDTLTDDTDSTGLATVSYYGQGTGDLYIKSSVDSIISSEIYVEDCIDYQPLTSNATASRWTIPSGVTSSYSSDGWNISANAYKQVKLTDKLTSDCSVEFTLSNCSANSSGPSVIIFAYTNGETTPNINILTGGTSKTSDRAVFNTQLDHDLIIGAKYRIEYTSSTIKVYEDNVLLGSASNTIGLPTRFEIHQGANSRYAIYKDIKVKPL